MKTVLRLPFFWVPGLTSIALAHARERVFGENDARCNSSKGHPLSRIEHDAASSQIL
jgi:hypothetical protein